MSSKCAKNKYSFKMLEKVHITGNLGVCRPVEYNDHIFKNVWRHQNTLFWLDEAKFYYKTRFSICNMWIYTYKGFWHPLNSIDTFSKVYDVMKILFSDWTRPNFIVKWRHSTCNKMHLNIWRVLEPVKFDRHVFKTLWRHENAIFLIGRQMGPIYMVKWRHITWFICI